MGGLVGLNRGPITKSYASGNVSGTRSSSSQIGGLVGFNDKANITNSYATGSVSGSGSAIGGLVGGTFSTFTITNSYATGSVSGTGSNIGGLVGILNVGGTISNSYWLDSSASRGGTNVNDTETERTVEQLTSPTAPGASSTDTYHNWTTNNWVFGTSEQFPTIKLSDSDTLTSLPPCTLNLPDEDGDGVKHAVDIDKDGDGLIEICDLEGLDEIRNNLTGSGTAGQGCPRRCRGFELARSLDFMDNNDYRRQTNKAIYTVSDYEDGNDNGWDPIGESASSSVSFRARRFDGNGYTISHLMINRSTNYVGLFGYTFGGSNTITDLGLLNVDIKGADQVGSLAGRTQPSITNSYATGSVSGNNEVGGLVGLNNGSITYSYAAVKVNGSGVVGGLVGFSTGGGSRITNSYATGSVSGFSEIGGLLGRNGNSGIVANSYATGNVDGSSSVSVGGLVGETFTRLGGSNVGGITNSYATGSVSGSGAQVGGLVGFNNSVLDNSYWLSGSASIGGAGVDDADAEKTAEELKSPIGPGTASTTATYYNWSENDWDFGTSDQYPVLKDSDGNLIPGQGTTLTGSSLRESLRELEIPEVRTTSSQIFGVSTNNYVVTIFLRAGITTDSIVLRLRAYNPDAEIQIFKEGDDPVIDYFEGKMSGDESLPIVVGAETKLTIMVDEPDTDYTLTFRVEEILGIKIRVKVFLEGPLQ